MLNEGLKEAHVLGLDVWHYYPQRLLVRAGLPNAHVNVSKVKILIRNKSWVVSHVASSQNIRYHVEKEPQALGLKVVLCHLN